MSRRCKAGQRARVIREGKNLGAIVLIVKPYFYPDMVSDAKWPRNLLPWVVTSLGAPLQSFSIDDGREWQHQTIVMDDTDLQPLEDDDDGLSVVEAVTTPKGKSAPLPTRTPQKALADGDE